VFVYKETYSYSDDCLFFWVLFWGFFFLLQAGGPSAGVQPGYEELGYSKAEATVLVAKLVEEARIAAEEAGLKRERERERE
jgi:hypothetical protein